MSQKRPQFPNENLALSWDIFQATGTKFRLHSDLSLSHVKGIYWKSPAQAIRHFQATSTISWLNFLVNGFLPVGKQVHRQHMKNFGAQPPTSKVEKWSSTGIAAALASSQYKDPVFANLLINGLHQWLLDTPHPPPPRFPKYASLVEHQQCINCFLVGGLSDGQIIKHRTFNDGVSPPRVNHLDLVGRLTPSMNGMETKNSQRPAHS
jgi:hypothetical protein